MRRAGDPRGRGTSAWLTAVRERRFRNVTEKLLMMTLCDYINGDDECWPGNLAVADDVGVDPRTVRRTLDRLEKQGVISRRRRSSAGRGGRETDAIKFHWEGFQRLPLVCVEGDNTPPSFEGDILPIEGDNSTPIEGDNSALPTIYRTPQVEPPKQPATSAAAFEAFYAAYPRHEGKLAGAKAWQKALAAAGGDAQRIIDGAMRYRNDPNREPAYTAHPGPWLNAGRWDDDPLPQRNGSRPMNPTDQRTVEAMEWAERRRARREGQG